MRILIVYATREGQTRRIVEYLAGALQARDVRVDIFNAAQQEEPDFESYHGAVIAGSVHVGHHEPELVRFVKRHRQSLERIPTALISVSLAQAGAEDARRTREQRQRTSRNVAVSLEKFFEETGWHPRWTWPVAGALLYTKYNFFVRFIMKMISKQEGGSTDTTRDHEYTDWAVIEGLAAEIVASVTPSSSLLMSVPPTVASGAP